MGFATRASSNVSLRALTSLGTYLKTGLRRVRLLCLTTVTASLAAGFAASLACRKLCQTHPLQETLNSERVAYLFRLPLRVS